VHSPVDANPVPVPLSIFPCPSPPHFGDMLYLLTLTHTRQSCTLIDFFLTPFFHFPCLSCLSVPVFVYVAHMPHRTNVLCTDVPLFVLFFFFFFFFFFFLLFFFFFFFLFFFFSFFSCFFSISSPFLVFPFETFHIARSLFGGAECVQYDCLTW